MLINIAKGLVLERLLMRKRKPDTVTEGVDLGLVLTEILEWANKLVPSEAGAILLDDPALKLEPSLERRLYYVACFGEQAAELAGNSISEKDGIAGEAYSSSKPYLIEDIERDKRFVQGDIDLLCKTTCSVICAPVAIQNSVIGVIEMVNSKVTSSYSETDLALLEIFAGYTATLMENALDARGFEELSKRDGLTGLYNDRYMFACLEHEIGKTIKKGGDTAIIFLDLDRFKEVNDTYGHLSGSRVLREVGDILRRVFRDADAIVARYGGDEFVIIMPGAGMEEGMKHAEALQKAIRGFTFLKEEGRDGEPPLNISGIISCSAGVALLSQHASLSKDSRQLANALLSAADNAMYLAKERGKDRVVMSEETA